MRKKQTTTIRRVLDESSDSSFRVENHLSDEGTCSNDNSVIETTGPDTSSVSTLYDKQGNPVLPDGTPVIQPTLVDDIASTTVQFDFKDGVRTNSSIGVTSTAPTTTTTTAVTMCSEPGVMDVIKCTCCQSKIDPFYRPIEVHPVLRVSVCKRCYKFYKSSEFKQDDDGKDDHCRWCAEGGTLVCCDSCPNAFCKSCIKKNLGRTAIQEIEALDEDEEWLCYVCKPDPIQQLQQECAHILEKVRQFEESKRRRSNRTRRRPAKCDESKFELSAAALPPNAKALTAPITSLDGGSLVKRQMVLTSSNHRPNVPLSSQINTARANSLPMRGSSLTVQHQLGIPPNSTVRQGNSSLGGSNPPTVLSHEWYLANTTAPGMLNEIRTVKPGNIRQALAATRRCLDAFNSDMRRLDSDLSKAKTPDETEAVIRSFQSIFRFHVFLRLGKISSRIGEEVGRQRRLQVLPNQVGGGTPNPIARPMLRTSTPIPSNLTIDLTSDDSSPSKINSRPFQSGNIIRMPPPLSTSLVKFGSPAVAAKPVMSTGTGRPASIKVKLFPKSKPIANIVDLIEDDDDSKPSTSNKNGLDNSKISQSEIEVGTEINGDSDHSPTVMSGDKCEEISMAESNGEQESSVKSQALFKGMKRKADKSKSKSSDEEDSDGKSKSKKKKSNDETESCSSENFQSNHRNDKDDDPNQDGPDPSKNGDHLNDSKLTRRQTSPDGTQNGHNEGKPSQSEPSENQENSETMDDDDQYWGKCARFLETVFSNSDFSDYEYSRKFQTHSIIAENSSNSSDSTPARRKKLKTRRARNAILSYIKSINTVPSSLTSVSPCRQALKDLPDNSMKFPDDNSTHHGSTHVPRSSSIVDGDVNPVVDYVTMSKDSIERFETMSVDNSTGVNKENTQNDWDLLCESTTCTSLSSLSSAEDEKSSDSMKSASSNLTTPVQIPQKPDVPAALSLNNSALLIPVSKPAMPEKVEVTIPLKDVRSSGVFSGPDSSTVYLSDKNRVLLGMMAVQDEVDDCISKFEAEMFRLENPLPKSESNRNKISQKNKIKSTARSNSSDLSGFETDESSSGSSILSHRSIHDESNQIKDLNEQALDDMLKDSPSSLSERTGSSMDNEEIDPEEKKTTNLKKKKKMKPADCPPREAPKQNSSLLSNLTRRLNALDSSDDDFVLPKSGAKRKSAEIVKISSSSSTTANSSIINYQQTNSSAVEKEDDQFLSDSSDYFKENVKKKILKKKILDSKTKALEYMELSDDSEDPIEDNQPEIEAIPANEEEDGDIQIISQTLSQKSSKPDRRNIRPIMDEKMLSKSSKEAERRENERLKRLEERQNRYNKIIVQDDGEESVTHTMVLERDTEGRAIIEVHPLIAKHLKRHQVQAVSFLWEVIIESVDIHTKSLNIHKDERETRGAMLAHCMGLGKSLSAIAFIHTVLTHRDILKMETCIILAPKTTLKNWKDEWSLWQPRERKLRVFSVLQLKNSSNHWDTLDLLREWKRSGGILLINYEKFTCLVSKTINSTELNPNISEAMRNELISLLLDPGPDIVVCDEGHVIKNITTQKSLAVSKFTTKRRLVLTGTPLQNSLNEYYTMVNFVKPDILGTKNEFRNRFVNPIQNGQLRDSNHYDIKKSKQRVHVLRKKLEGFVHRAGIRELRVYLPPKCEYILYINLTESQCNLYAEYMKLVEKRSGSVDLMNRLFADLAVFMKICLHPWLLRRKLDKEEAKNMKKSLIQIVPTEVLAVESVQNHPAPTTSQPENREIPDDWWKKLYQKEHFDHMVECGSKLDLVFHILRKSTNIGDKVLIFSRYLLSLDVVEHFMKMITERGDDPRYDAFRSDEKYKTWIPNKDYVRLDGSVKMEDRVKIIERFQDPNNDRLRVFLLSTGAGGLGINLTEANRVILLDVSWNPSNDDQSCFRSFRMGQKKPVYIYRLVTFGTMEKRMFDRAVSKTSLSERVVDKKETKRFYTANELNLLYIFEPTNSDPNSGSSLTKFIKSGPDGDLLLADIIKEVPGVIRSLEDKDILLADQEHEKLTEDEYAMAFIDYEQENQEARAGPEPNSTHADLPVASTSAGAASVAGSSQSSSLPFLLQAEAQPNHQPLINSIRRKFTPKELIYFAGLFEKNKQFTPFQLQLMNQISDRKCKPSLVYKQSSGNLDLDLINWVSTTTEDIYKLLTDVHGHNFNLNDEKTKATIYSKYPQLNRLTSINVRLLKWLSTRCATQNVIHPGTSRDTAAPSPRPPASKRPEPGYLSPVNKRKVSPHTSTNSRLTPTSKHPKPTSSLHRSKTPPSTQNLMSELKRAYHQISPSRLAQGATPSVFPRNCDPIVISPESSGGDSLNENRHPAHSTPAYQPAVKFGRFGTDGLSFPKSQSKK